MNPVVFPFTFIAEEAINRLGAFFNPFALYRMSSTMIAPMQDAAKRGTLVTHSPEPGIEKTVDRLYRECRDWQVHHQGTDISFSRLDVYHTPFFNGLSQSQILSQIKHYGGSKKKGPANWNPLLQAALFLKMAEAFDLQNWEIARGLRSQDALSREMVGEIQHGTVGGAMQRDAAHKPETARGSAEYMLAQRITAWRIYVACQETLPAILITDSPAAWASFMETLDDGIVVENLPPCRMGSGTVDSPKAMQSALISRLDDLIRSDWRGPDLEWPVGKDAFGNHRMALHLSILPDTPPHEVFAQEPIAERIGRHAERVPSDIRHSLVGYIENEGLVAH